MQEAEIDFERIICSLPDAQREAYQKITGSDGRERSETGVDITALRVNLKLTPTERIEKMRRQMAFLLAVRRAGLEAGGEPA